MTEFSTDTVEAPERSALWEEAAARSRMPHRVRFTRWPSPAAWIRHRRLERCRLALANPRLNARPIQAIATRWGFTDPAHFSRLFRAAYGIPPRDHRNLPHTVCANRQQACAD
nr:helix-turn-helix transcriptional regulator [Streptomyces botrytidirepellens]